MLSNRYSDDSVCLSETIKGKDLPHLLRGEIPNFSTFVDGKIIRKKNDQREGGEQEVEELFRWKTFKE